jgi:hypothetical protein
MSDPSAACPFLVPVVADRLWMYPTAAYCRSRDRVRVPATTTIGTVCAGPSHRQCAGYRAGITPPARPQAARPSARR